MIIYSIGSINLWLFLEVYTVYILYLYIGVTIFTFADVLVILGHTLLFIFIS